MAKTVPSLLPVFFYLAFLGVLASACSPSNTEATTRVHIVPSPLTVSRFPFDQPNDNRPPFLLLMPNRTLEDFAEFVWSIIVTNPSKPGVIQVGGPRTIKYGYQLEGQYGTAPETIEQNLKALSNTLGQISWKRRGIGYVIGPAGDQSKTGLVVKHSLPPCVLLSPNLEASLTFLTELTGTQIQLVAAQYVSTVLDRNPFHANRFLTPRQFHFTTSSNMPLEEFLKDLSSFHGCVATVAKDGYAIVDASPDQLRDLVRAVVLKFRGGGSYPFPWNFTLPSSAAPELATYLNDNNENTVQQVIISLMAVNERVGENQLLQILRNSSRGKETRVMAACALAQMGNESVLPFLNDLSDIEYLLEDLIISMRGIQTQNGFDAQRRLIKSRQPAAPNYKSEPLKIDKLPPNCNFQELQEMEKAAVGFANLFAKPHHRQQLPSSISLSPDGREALCTLTKGNSKTRSFAGEDYLVHFKKFGNWWFIVGGWSGASWVE